MTVIASCWFLFSLTIGVAATMRGRNPIGWFLLAALISPLAAALFVLALPPLTLPAELFQALANGPPLFESDGVHAGVPYRLNKDETVDGMTEAGAVIRFRRMDEFTAFVECRVGRVLS